MKKTLILVTIGVLLGSTIAFAASRFFSDVPAGEWYSSAVASLSEKGIISGYSNGTFGPGKNVTRAEVAVMLDKLIQYLGANGITATGEYHQYPLIIKNMDPVVYNTTKFYINDIPYQVKEIGQKQEWRTHFFAQDQFIIKVEPHGYINPVPSASRTFAFEELVREHPNCKSIKQTIVPIEVEIKSRDDIAFKVGEYEFGCPL